MREVWEGLREVRERFGRVREKFEQSAIRLAQDSHYIPTITLPRTRAVMTQTETVIEHKTSFYSSHYTIIHVDKSQGNVICIETKDFRLIRELPNDYLKSNIPITELNEPYMEKGLSVQSVFSTRCPKPQIANREQLYGMFNNTRTIENKCKRGKHGI